MSTRFVGDGSQYGIILNFAYWKRNGWFRGGRLVMMMMMRDAGRRDVVVVQDWGSVFLIWW